MSDIVGLVINPITWIRTETVATVAEGLGSFMPDPVTAKFIMGPQYADAKVNTNKGVLICNTADSNLLYQFTTSDTKGNAQRAQGGICLISINLFWKGR
ncbi:MAG: hypothetical protein WCO63_04290 [Bacteroidota bacterium]